MKPKDVGRRPRCSTMGCDAAVFTGFVRGPGRRSIPRRTRLACTFCGAEVEPDDIPLPTFRLFEEAHRLDNEREWEDHQLFGPS